MAVIVDRAIWRWRGRRWAHLASDHSHGELHAFAARLGLRRAWFQGDHYDVAETVRVAALALGAEPVDARELVRRLRAAGLRRGRALTRAVPVTPEPQRGHRRGEAAVTSAPTPPPPPRR